MINFVYNYYENPKMLERQIECWNSYQGVIKNLPGVILVDDGSPKNPAAEIVQRAGCQIPIQVFRIKEDIVWNNSGARNLGCVHAEEWIYMSDMDMLLLAEDAWKLCDDLLLDVNFTYWPKRVFLRDLKGCDRSSVHLVFHKSQYVKVGGYDEDYAGFYGKEHADFFMKLQKVTKIVPLDDVAVHIVSPSMIKDAFTRGQKRDPARNDALLSSKIAAGLVSSVNPLRFTWERVL